MNACRVLIFAVIFSLGASGATSCDCKGIWEKIQEMAQANRESFCKLGLQSGYIPDNALSASSVAPSYAVRYGRLDTPHRVGYNYGAWQAQTDAVGQWIQVELAKPTKITGVITQGRNDGANEWVTKYKITYLTPYDENWKTVKFRNGADALLPGNIDRNSKTTNMFYEPVTAVKLRLVVQEWHGHISLRHEYLTC